MTPEQITELIGQILSTLRGQGIEIEADGEARINVQRPKSREHGDWATNIAMQLAKKAGLNPRDLAEKICVLLRENTAIDQAEIAGPGFINIRLAPGAAGALVTQILRSGCDYGKNDSLKGTHINLEYVSANPTGPVHLGGARWAAVGDTLSRLFKSCSAQVTREYYFNDHGSQIDRFAASLLARAKGEEIPEDGYGGQYISDIAQQVREIARNNGEEDPVNLPEKQSLEYFRAKGVELMFEQIKTRLKDFRCEFDVFFHEDSLHHSGAVARAVETLKDRGMVREEDGATWLETTRFGDDKDRVLIKSDGAMTYFAGDVAYYLDKRSRGADCAIYLLGADHHGYIGRMMAMCEAFGDVPKENLQILIGQLVNLYRDGVAVRMSKRAGTIVTLDDFVEAVGVDAARYALVRSSMDTQLDIDLNVLASASNENPVYYVQYAHARTCNVARRAGEQGVEMSAGFNPEKLDHEADSQLLGQLARFPKIIEIAAKGRETHRLAHYLEELAAAYHTWYNQRRVTPRGGEKVDETHVALLYLNNAVTQVLANGLTMLGVQAPAQM